VGPHARVVALVAALVVPVEGLLATGCDHPRPPALYPAGSPQDDGAGQLARASARLTTEDVVVVDPGSDAPPAPSDQDADGAPADDPAFGGEGYGRTFKMPQWKYHTPNRSAPYRVQAGLTGALDGTITWNGEAPPAVATACGTIPNPTLHVGAHGALRGALVYIAEVTTGRAAPYFGRPAPVGGIVAKHGCALTPAVQLVPSIPTAMAIHGDRTRTRIRVVADHGEPRTYALEEAGVVRTAASVGVTRVEGADGTLAPAWVVGLVTPYYALTDDQGRFRIDGLAPGRYSVTIWQPPVVTTRPDGTFTYGAPIITHRTVTVRATATAHLAVSLGRHPRASR